jgi:6-phosphogluconolactonase
LIRSTPAEPALQAAPLLYVGTHRRAHRADPEDCAFGIYGFRPDSGSGAGSAWNACGLAETPQPGWLALHPQRGYLYAVNEVRQIAGREGGAVTAFSIDRQSGILREINTLPLPAMPCHCVVDASGQFLLVATFGGGSVHLFRLGEDGGLAEECDRHVHSGSSLHPQRQTAPHAHAVVLSPGNRFVLVPDLGLDKVLVYEFDAVNGQLAPRDDLSLALPPLSGPRHAVFSPDGRHVYLVNEMSAQVVVLGWDETTGVLTPRQTAELLPEGFSGIKSGAAIEVHPDGRFLYVTTRSHGSSGMPSAPGLDLLVWFSVDPDSGELTLGERLPSGGGIPRSMALSPDAKSLLIGHQCSGRVTKFGLSDGIPVSPETAFEVPVPVCLLFFD